MSRERGTRRAVQQALRTGRARDARIDALARETADRTVRNSWLLVFFSVLLLVQVSVLIIRIAAGDDLWGTVLAVATGALWATALGVFWVMRRRSRRYLRSGSVH